MRTRLAAHPPWKQLVIVTVVFPLVLAAAVLAFAWPTARIAPRDLPVGVVGSTPAGQALVAELDAQRPGAFDFRLYPDADAARNAIRHRDVYGAFAAAPHSVTVFEASAASPAVAGLLTATAHAVSNPDRSVAVADVVPVAAGDPHGSVLSATMLPLTICGILIASGIGVVIQFRPAWRQILALLNVSVVAGAGVYLIAQTWLGVLPHRPAATWLALAWLILAISSTTAGLVALIGPPGLGLAAVLMVFVGNPLSGVTSAPELLPSGVGQLGQRLPPGAAASLLRSTAYFDCAGARAHLAVLIGWTLVGMCAIAVGHHAPIRFAAHARIPDRLGPAGGAVAPGI
jgi:hypothetical protein